MLNRRGLITGLISLVAAPTIVRASSLMPIKVMEQPGVFTESQMRELLRTIWANSYRPQTIIIGPLARDSIAYAFTNGMREGEA